MNDDAKNNNEKSRISKSPDDKFTREIMALLLKQIPEDMNLIESSYKVKDWAKLTFYVHKLHGALCYTQFNQAKTAAMRLENMLREKKRNLSKIADSYQLFQTEIRAIMNAESSK